MKTRKGKIIAAVSAAAAVALLAAAVFAWIVPLQKLKKAVALLETGDREAAYAELESVRNYGLIGSARYERAAALREAREPVAAYLLLDKLNLRDSAALRAEIGRELLKNAQPGDLVFFGAYEQDGKERNGSEAIAWRVLETDGASLLLISNFALDCVMYNSECVDTTWETSALRAWLNGEFLNAAFSAEERDAILLSSVTADANPGYSTPAGPDTKDKIYLLSTQETQRYFASDAERQCFATAYTISRGAFTSKPYTPNGEVVSENGKPACTWWTRTPGDKPQQVSLVFYDGSVEYYGHEVNDRSLAVRPVLRVRVDG